MSRIAVIGGGLAGTCIATELIRRGADVTLFHTNSSPGAAASMVPLALFNPAAALKAKKSKFAEEALEALNRLFDSFSLSDDPHIVDRSGVFRPCIDAETSENFKTAFHEEPWPEDWVSWIDTSRVRRLFPELIAESGLMVHAGMTVDTPAFIQKMHDKLLVNKNFNVKEEKISKCFPDGERIRLQTSGGSEESYSQVVFACGYGVRSFDLWESLPLHFVKGQTLSLKKMPFPNPACSVSARGYLALLNEKLTIGSTYEHYFSDLNPTESARKRLIRKVSSVYPDVNPSVFEKAEQWTGVRITTPDRLPYIGAHFEHSNIFIATGFGSKGLMYSPLCGKYLSDFILNQTKIPAPFDVRRLYETKKWQRENPG